MSLPAEDSEDEITHSSSSDETEEDSEDENEMDDLSSTDEECAVKNSSWCNIL